MYRSQARYAAAASPPLVWFGEPAMRVLQQQRVNCIGKWTRHFSENTSSLKCCCSFCTGEFWPQQSFKRVPWRSVVTMSGLSSLSRKSQLPGLARLAALRIAKAKNIQGSSDGRVAGISHFASHPLVNIHEHQTRDDLTLFSIEDSKPDRVTERYRALRDWIYTCLDTYQGELRQLL